MSYFKVKDCKDKVSISTITRTPGVVGAQFSFKELLFEVAELKVNDVAII